MTRTVAVARRVLQQITGDGRTVLLLLSVPSLLIGLFSWMLNSETRFNSLAPNLVGLFPFTVMFLLASITMLRERLSGTLERFMTTPMRRGEFIAGYALAFGALAAVQASVALIFTVVVCGLDVGEDFGWLLIAAIANAVLGMSLGLLASAFARTEYQVMQFMPAFIFPQIILGGLFVPTAQMPDALQTVSDWLPLTHSLRALSNIAAKAATADITNEILIVVALSLAALAIGSFTLRKRTE